MTASSSQVTAPTRPRGVGSTVMLPPAAIAVEAHAANDGSEWKVEAYAALVGAVVAIAIGDWYARRWLT